MENKRTLSLLRPIIIFALLMTGSAYGQCPQVFDFFGNAVDDPYWYSCSGGNFNFNLQSPDDWGEYEINWGDGTANTTGASWNSPVAINHLYTATVDTFVVSITEINTGCVIEGVVVMEEATSASIQIPVGGLTQACALKPWSSLTLQPTYQKQQHLLGILAMGVRHSPSITPTGTKLFHTPTNKTP